jgi:hypothetical protein
MQASQEIQLLEAMIFALLSEVDRTVDTQTRLKLWWQVEELRFKLEGLCGDHTPSPLLRPRKAVGA